MIQHPGTERKRQDGPVRLPSCQGTSRAGPFLTLPRDKPSLAKSCLAERQAVPCHIKPSDKPSRAISVRVDTPCRGAENKKEGVCLS